MYQRVFAGGLLIIAMVFSLQDAQCKALTKDISRRRLPFLYIKSDIILEAFNFFKLRNTLFQKKSYPESNSRKPSCRHFYQISRGLVFASKTSYFLNTRGRTNQHIANDGNKNCSLDTNLTFYWNSKFESRLEIELSGQKVA